MAQLIIHKDKIKSNIQQLSDFFEKHGKSWSLITKVFSGDKSFLKNILTGEVIQKINAVGDSRLTSLKNLKEVNPDMRTIYIKPPAAIYAKDVVKYADISLNSSLRTIKALNEAAMEANVIHQIIIMIELGELREGVQRDDILSFYEKVFSLDHIDVIGIGSNLGCMYGVEPTFDKLLQLSLYRELISLKFNKELKFVSGGTSITLPLIERDVVPKDINHFRVGEAAFFGMSPLENKRFMNLHTDTFEFQANIIELEEKKLVPDGVISDANIGHTIDYHEQDIHQKSFKAILDFGLLDVDQNDLTAVDEEISFVGITSDMLVIDIGTNQTKDGKTRYKVGDKVDFKVNYMAVARLLNSKFIDKVFKSS